MSLFPEFCLPHGVLSLKIWAPNGAILHSFWFPDQDRWLKCFFLFFSFRCQEPRLPPPTLAGPALGRRSPWQPS